MEDSDRAPVIIGIGEVLDRPADVGMGKEPLVLMAEALRHADEDAGGSWLTRIESLDVVNSMTWGYLDLPGQLSAALGISPARRIYGEVGGDTPVRYIHEAAIRIAAGEIEVAAICGAEAAHTLDRADRDRIALPWTPEGPKPQRPRREGVLHPSAIRHGLIKPLYVYPIYEYAARAAWNQGFEEAQTETAGLWSQFSAVAASNPYAWLGRIFEPCEIATPWADNRMVAGPYTKLMVALPTVNLGAAAILTNFGRAKALGVPEHKMVFIWGGSAAMEPRDFVSRDQYEHSTAMDAVLGSARELAERNRAQFDLVELYSCFPCVPKMARRSLGLSAEVVPSVTGSLTFFGAPLNNYMSHAVAAMTRSIRAANGAAGLLYGQGGFVTRHHAIVLAGGPPRNLPSREYDVQADADRRRGPIPVVEDQFTGEASVETFTVVYDREGQPEWGVVFCRTRTGSRVLARVDGQDNHTLSFVANQREQVVGATGRIHNGSDDLLHWST